MRIFVLAALAAAVVASPSAALAQAKPIVIKFSHVDSPDSIRGKGAQRFKDLAEKNTGGKVKVEVYPNGTLANDKAEIEALQRGSVQMLAPSTTKFTALGVKEFEVLELPYLFPTSDAFFNALAGPVASGLLAKLDSKGITGLAFWDDGFQVISSNKPVVVPAEVKGLKVRISGSKVADQNFRGLGALPQVMAFSEVYQALQGRVIDATENTPSALYSQKLHEVQPYIVLTNHSHLQYAVVVDAKFWSGLPADIRTQLANALRDATPYVNAMAKSEQQNAMAAIKASGKSRVQDLTPTQLADWKKAMQSTDKAAKGRAGQETYDGIVNALMKQGYK